MAAVSDRCANANEGASAIANTTEQIGNSFIIRLTPQPHPKGHGDKDYNILYKRLLEGAVIAYRYKY